jgi:2-keto-4-pentenoate hydratase
MSDDISLAERLIRAEANDVPLPAPSPAPTVEQAYAIQRAIFERRMMPTMVWKLGLTGEGPRAALGSADPVVGRLPASAIYLDRSEVSLFGAEMYGEAEIVLEFGADLPPRDTPYEAAEVAMAIKGVYAGIELATTRFESSGLSLGNLIADNCLGYGLVLGDRLHDGWLDTFADLPVTMTRAGHPPETGSTSRAMGSPLAAATWLANWLGANETGIQREQLIATGNCAGITRLFAGDVVTARFAGRWQASITILNQ